VGDLRTAVGKDMAGNPLAQDATIVGIGKQSTGVRHDYRWVLASNALAREATIEGVGVAK
jgi:hypothetical protein